MNYIVFDLEWNQSNTGREPEVEELPFEIIEIGAVKLNSEMKFIGEFSQLVKPEVYQEMHYITRKLIHIQMAELQGGRPFPIVMDEFLDWCGEDCVFCTWGPLDLMELQRNMRFYDMTPLSDKPFKFYDVQKLFSLAYEDGKKRRSLEYAIDFLQMEKDIPFHRAFSDAYYAGKVLEQISLNDQSEDKTILHNFSYDVFNLPKKKSDEINIVFDNYGKYISREFDTKELAMEDKEVVSLRCCYCHKSARKKIRWFSTNAKVHISLGYCPKHGYMMGKIRMKKAENDNFYVIKTIQEIDDAQASFIREKQLELRKKRQIKRLRKRKSN